MAAASPRRWMSVLAFALVLAACSGQDRSAPERDAPAAPPPPVAPAHGAGEVPGPMSTAGLVPVGYARTEAGAAAAATTYLSTLHGLALVDPAARREALTRISAAGADAAVQTALDSLGVLDAVLGEARRLHADARAFVRDVPVAYDVQQFSPERARVAVWSVGLILVEGRTLATQVWSTNTVDLVWEGQDWRVWSWGRTPGPQPAVSTEVEPTPPAQVLDTVGRWEGYRYVPS